jgi:Multicopper oxidase
MKIIIDGDADDHSVMPRPGDRLRDRPTPKLTPGEMSTAAASAVARGKDFTLMRSNQGDPESSWQINGKTFDPLVPLASQHRGDADVWVIRNGGGGWVHPMHLHQEEHHVLTRDGVPSPGVRHPDDTGKMDVVSLDPSEEVVLYRQFRTFTGPYVAHCHNLAHEDHNMMFGWEILPAAGDPPVDQSPLGAHPDDGGNGGGGGGVDAGVGALKPGAKGKGKKTVATLSVKLMRHNGRRILRCKVSDSRSKAKERLALRLRHGGKTMSLRHPTLRKGHGSFDIPVSHTYKGRYEVMLTLDDGTTVRRNVTIR